MHKIHNSCINIFGVIPLCQFLKEPGQVTHVFRGTPNFSFGRGVTIHLNNVELYIYANMNN